MKVCTVDEMRALDRQATAEHGIPQHTLMENAGAAVYEVVRRELGVAGRRFVVLCGLGNNGGDGFVVARKLRASGGAVEAFVLGDPERYREPARRNFEILAASGAPIAVRPATEAIVEAMAGCDAVIDALLGTGLTREVEGQTHAVIEAVNRAGAPVVSVDIPSGVDGNTGQVGGVAVRASLTVTFGLPKRGNLLYPGAELCGRLFLTHISYPPQLAAADDLLVEVNTPPPLPARPADGHKGSFGDVLFVAGAPGYFGAPAFSALSLLKAGGGYARLAAPRSLCPHLAAIASEVVFAPQDETAEGSLALGALEGLLNLGAEVDFVVLGPGLSLAEEAQELARRLASQIDKPLLIDGDGLSAVAQELDVVRGRQAPTILTPHPGEMSRIAGVPVSEIESDRIGVTQRAASDLEAIVVLKGAHSLIGDPDGRVFVNLSGNSGMASAGSGDVLTGTVAAMYGLGLSLEDAVRAGVFMHGFAGDLAAAEIGEDGITARDILAALPGAVRTYRERYADVIADGYGKIEIV